MAILAMELNLTDRQAAAVTRYSERRERLKNCIVFFLTFLLIFSIHRSEGPQQDAESLSMQIIRDLVNKNSDPPSIRGRSSFTVKVPSKASILKKELRVLH